MVLEPKQDLLGIAVTQLFILNIAWGFYIVVRVRKNLSLPDAAARWVYNNPTETTVIVTILATIVSSMTMRYAHHPIFTWILLHVRIHSCFTRAAKHALRQYIGSQRSISLANLSMGVTVASASFAFKRRPRYLGQTLGTLIIATVFGLVNSAYVQL